jgi:hypothetical protein
LRVPAQTKGLKSPFKIIVEMTAQCNRRKKILSQVDQHDAGARIILSQMIFLSVNFAIFTPGKVNWRNNTPLTAAALKSTCDRFQ